jgi:hypothetical protein
MAVELNPKEALVVFVETHSDWEPITMWNYDVNSYLLYAKDKNLKGDVDYNDPYFLIDKKSGVAMRYSSMGDFDKFTAAIDSKQLAKLKG